MKFRLYREFGSLNSRPVFDALEKSLRHLGYPIVDNNEDIPVIWSVLWNGRMEKNRYVYERSRKDNRPILILEVGNLVRNQTWRVSLNHVNGLGIFAHEQDLDTDRPNKLGINLRPYRSSRKPEILIACQHQKSLQWQGMPIMQDWIKEKIAELKKYTDRRVVIRSHPRSPFVLEQTDVRLERPRQLQGTYDDFDINYDYHCVINHNSGPAIAAVINGVPVITDTSSLAWPVSNMIENVESLENKSREDWLIKLSHTEWTVKEIENGIPMSRLLGEIKNLF